MQLPEIAPASLQLFVFGPGVGELVLVRAPPDDWLVVDGCAAGRVKYAPLVLAHYQAQPRLILLSHPHLDHSKGVADVIDAATRGPDTARWPKLGCVGPQTRACETGDPAADLPVGETEEAIDAIHERWERAPACRWDLSPGRQVSLGDATVLVVSPELEVRERAEEAARSGERFDPNILSTALAIDWGGVRIILGSDLLESPGRGWSSAFARSPRLDEHHACKIAHHGSEDAQYGPLLMRRVAGAEPTWIVAPFAPSDLPRFGTGGGASTLLVHVPVFHLTALPRAHAAQAAAPADLSLRELADHRGIRFERTTAGFPDCFVMVAFAANGQPALSYGPGSVRVHQ